MPEHFDAAAEFDRQVGLLIELGYPRLTGLSTNAFGELLEPLRTAAITRAPATRPTRERVPFVIAIGRDLVRPSRAMPLTVHNGRSGFVSRDTQDVDEFPTHPDIDLPPHAWLLLDVDRGRDTLGATPEEARARFATERRQPLTVEEGIAFLTQFPESLEKNNCYQLPGTQLGRRVPGLWISARAPKLGYCWAGNRHTWLGHASCAERIGLAESSP